MTADKPMVHKVEDMLKEAFGSGDAWCNTRARFLAIDIVKMAMDDFGVEMPMELAPKRARASASGERSKPLKLAAARIEAEEFTKREVTDQLAINIMARAKALLNDGPDTQVALCSNLNMEDITNIEKFMNEDDERNGPAFYLKLLPYFVPDIRQFRAIFEQHSTVKNAMEKSWNFRMHTLFMNADCSMTREGIAAALNERRIAIKKQEEERDRNLQINNAVQQQFNAALQDPQAIAHLLNDPRVQAMLGAARGAAE
jgi:hypothetical protein